MKTLRMGDMKMNIDYSRMIEGIILLLIGYGTGLLAMRCYDMYLLKLNGYHWRKLVKR